MIGQPIAHAESIRCCERSSPCDAISRPPAVGGARSAAGHAARTEAAALEMNVLRVEVEQLRAIKREAHNREEFLSASLNRIIESRDHWRREADRALIAQVPPWSLFWWSCVDAFKAWRKPTDRGLNCA
jgi:hypothetical protein